jgi:hypothetical protein
MSPRVSAFSDDSFSEDLSDAAGDFQARKRRALEKCGYNRRFDMVNNDDDLSDITMSQGEVFYMTFSQEEISFQARKQVALKKYGHNDGSMLFDVDLDDDLTETSTRSESTSSSESTCSSNNKKNRSSSVRFSTVSIRSFDRAIGDHPCCKEGPALTLDWDYQQQPDISVETYETTRKPRKRRLFPMERITILSGWPKEEVSEEAIESPRKQRFLKKLAKLFCRKS